MKKFLIAALLVASTAVSTAASAAVLSLNGSLTNGWLTDNTYKSVFTGLSALKGDYTVNSLSFTFSFMDDQDWAWKFDEDYKETSGAYVKNSNGHYYRDTAATKSDLYESEAESAKLFFGTSLIGTGSTAGQTLERITDTKESLRIDDIKCKPILDCTFYKSNLTTTYQDVFDNTGAFNIHGVVTTGALIESLLRDGQLSLGLKISGDLVLTGAKLVLDYTRIEPPVEQPGEVPEPSSLLLAGAGLAAVGFARRRRSTAAQA